ncbi:MAG TPA: hypothetical protein VMU25_02375 [Candidatus Paceibacterota bacterium]|nr:hypothetical protein [Candidatus Paceibacterota bacterium]
MKKFFKGTPAGIGLLFQAQFQPLTSTNNAPSLSGFFTNGDLVGFFNSAFTLALSLGAILAVLRIAYAGWKYMSTDAFGQKTDAKEMIKNALIGLLLLLGIWIILNQINPDLLNLNILRDIGGGSQTQTQSTQSNANVTQVIPAATSNVNGQPVDQNNNPLQTQPL